MNETVLVRYGAIAEVARFEFESVGSLGRDVRVVVRTRRGLELGTLLDTSNDSPKADENEVASEIRVVRQATADDESRSTELRSKCDREFETWCRRIQSWKLKLELIDLEWTLDRSKLILYVLNDRGPDCTQLALQAAAAGLGIVEVQPVDSQGLVTIDTPNAGCGCNNNGCQSG